MADYIGGLVFSSTYVIQNGAPDLLLCLESGFKRFKEINVSRETVKTEFFQFYTKNIL